MKPLIAFVGGALVAGSIALLVTNRGSEQPSQPAPQEVVQKTLEPQPSGSPAVVPTNPAPVSSFARAPQQRATPASGKTPPKSQEQATQQPSPQTPDTTPSSVPAASAPAAIPQQASNPAPAPAQAAPREPNRVTLAPGTPVVVRLVQTLSSETVHDGQTFEATLDQPIIVDGFAIAERGARVEGRVIDTEKAGRVKGVSHLSLELTRIHTSDGQKVGIQTQAWDKEGEQTRKSDAQKVAIGAGVGAALGAIFGGGKGAAIGAGSGGAAGTGVVLATRGKPVVLPVESKVSFRLRTAVTITER
ncbi:MAG: hypothetical protein HY820_40435 [Acidobacteria bacterium]|nr:hypothetical protein [Acidobacteriota bacterium]